MEKRSEGWRRAKGRLGWGPDDPVRSLASLPALLPCNAFSTFDLRACSIATCPLDSESSSYLYPELDV